MPAAGQQPVEPVAAWAGFEAEAEPTPAFPEPRRHLAQDLSLRTVLEDSDLSHLAATPNLGHRHAHRRLVHIKVISSIRPVPHA
jgi:hypothetical protein